MTSIIKIFREIGILTIALTAALVVNYAYGQVWNDPACGPTGCNAPAPINVSNTAQTKEGNLDIANPSGTAVLSTERSVIMHNSPQLRLQDTTVGDLDSRIVAANDNIQFQHDENDNPNSPSWVNAMILKNNSQASPAETNYARFYGELRVDTKVMAYEYCDVTGNNCIEPSKLLPNCQDGEFLMMDGDDWSCGAASGGGAGRYRWITGSYGTCTGSWAMATECQTSVGGTMTRDVTCWDTEDDVVVSDTNCEAALEPTDTASCTLTRPYPHSCDK